MAYLPDVKHDVFVSYSHGDPLGRGILKNWTLDLVALLEGHVRDSHPEFGGLAIWRDPMLDCTLQLTPQLKALVKSSAILFIIMSPFYLTSLWCKKEVNWFSEEIRDHSGRVFVIRAQPTDESEWPEFLHDLPGWSFHNGQDIPYCWADNPDPEDRKEYLKRLSWLRNTLIGRLRKLRDRVQRREVLAMTQTSPRRAKQRRIYLHARTEDGQIYQGVRDLLSKDGIIPICPPVSPGKELLSWERESKDRIAAAKLCDALALLRAKGDEKFIDTLIEVGLDDRERILSERGFPLPCAILDRSGDELPIDVSGLGIERFDIRNDNWRDDFRHWLDKANIQPLVAHT